MPLPHTLAFVQGGLQAGLHIGAQIYVSHRGQVLADEAIGEAKPGVPMTTDTAMVWLSAGKPVTAAAVCQLWEQGRLSLQDPVARYIPEFAAHGKTDTIWHLLTHTSSVRAGIMPKHVGWKEAIGAIAWMRPEPRWIPGQRAGYSGYNNWYLLGEIIHRVDGRPVERYVHDDILSPLGMVGSTMALTPDEYPAWHDRLGVLQRTEGGTIRPAEAHERDHRIPCRPGGSMHGPIRELAKLYEMLAGSGAGPEGRRVLRPETVAAMVSRQRHGMRDETFRRTVDWGLGLIINTPEAAEGGFGYGFGPYASADTLGHSGMQSSVGCYDPAHELVVAVVFNGQPGEVAHARRQEGFMRVLYEELGLVSGKVQA